jgi:hypothetical protein
MNFVCVYKSGGDYDVRYVRALLAAITVNCNFPFSFFCLTDRFEEIDPFTTAIRLEHDLPGWWSKLELFNPNHIFNTNGDPVLFFDLDVLILKNIDDLCHMCFQITKPMMLRSADSQGEKQDWPSSSIMSWKGSSMSKVYEALLAKGIQEIIEEVSTNTSRAGQQTDQGFIRTIVNPQKFQDHLPKDFLCFKIHYLKDLSLLEKISILNWTGQPRFHLMKKEYYSIKSKWNYYHKNLTLIKYDKR